ncbi:MAG: hypothetical protein AAFQ66_22325, partial [Pseudomonadota bacterium]
MSRDDKPKAGEDRRKRAEKEDERDFEQIDLTNSVDTSLLASGAATIAGLAGFAARGASSETAGFQANYDVGSEPGARSINAGETALDLADRAETDFSSVEPLDPGSANIANALSSSSAMAGLNDAPILSPAAFERTDLPPPELESQNHRSQGEGSPKPEQPQRSVAPDLEASSEPKEVWSPTEPLEVTAAEDATAASVLLLLPGADQYGDSVDYQITGSDGAPVDDSAFLIVGNELRLAPGAEFDFETAELMTVYLTATTEAGTSDPWPVAITIDDVAEAVTLADGGVAFTDRAVAEISITGGAGDDTIIGHKEGGDLAGGAGSDMLTGGAGA